MATLAQCAPLLKAAQDLEQRAESIYEWPLDDRLLRTMAVVVTGVLTGLVVRATLTLVGQ